MEGIDTFKDTSANNMAGFASAYNDMYLGDISRKTRSALQTMKKQGQFTGSYAPYGYKRDEQDKHKLAIDEPAAAIVRRVYDMYVGGVTMKSIAVTLNREGILSPGAYKCATFPGYDHRCHNHLWESGTVRDILSSPTYVGDMAQGKQIRVSYKSKKMARMPRSKWIIAKGSHVPIVDSATYDAAQMLLSKNQAYAWSTDGTEHLLNGLLFCGDCGGRLYVIREHTTRAYHTVCSSYRRYKSCTIHSVHERVLNDYVLNDLRRISKRLIDSKTAASKLKGNVPKPKVTTYEKELNAIAKELDDANKSLGESYQDKVRGLLSEADFVVIRDMINRKREELNDRREAIQSKLEADKNNVPVDYEKAIRQLLELETPNSMILKQLIEKVCVFQKDDGERVIKVHYTFPNPFDEE